MTILKMAFGFFLFRAILYFRFLATYTFVQHHYQYIKNHGGQLPFKRKILEDTKNILEQK